MAASTLTEAEKMARVPGIHFMGPPDRRRASLPDCGIDVWEAIQAYKEVDEDWDALKRWFDWLADYQLRAALDYYALFPEEIDARLALEEWWTEERIREHFPNVKVIDVVTED